MNDIKPETAGFLFTLLHLLIFNAGKKSISSFGIKTPGYRLSCGHKFEHGSLQTAQTLQMQQRITHRGFTTVEAQDQIRLNIIYKLLGSANSEVFVWFS